MVVYIFIALIAVLILYGLGKLFNRNGKKKSKTREWADAMVFAVIAATFVRTFFIEAYAIPTGSMEKSLLVGDYLFVSKMHYGARLPITPIAFPFAHNTMPLVGSKSYWDGLKLPYKRLPGLQPIRRNEPVVFNLPSDGGAPNYHPVDRKENYIKRAVGIPGDTLVITKATVFVNGQASPIPATGQYLYSVYTDGNSLNPQRLHDLRIDVAYSSPEYLEMFLTPTLAGTISNWSGVTRVEMIRKPKGNGEWNIFPDSSLHWNQDEYGSFIVPKKGWTTPLDAKTVTLYKKAISEYEGHRLEKRADGYYIDDRKATHYTFAMDYYWMMGDNRHNSLDSRYWGFVPEDHIVGKPLFVWLSLDEAGSLFEKIRWERFFMPIK
ncbi:signal peptidase I [Olivibacter sitiensis]|uniref:signal peptidase I n=1 Tax=Olivibacter sitiensis TaxID=376470 RepID=UPI0004091853|nr:signal peptidase I [Olivibacter sitiensis]